MNIKNIKYISKHITEQEKYIIVFKCKNPPVLLMDLFYNKCLFTFLFKLLSSFVYRLDLLDYKPFGTGYGIPLTYTQFVNSPLE